MTEIVDVGPWHGPTVEEWLKRISSWPTPWYRGVDKPLFDLKTQIELEKMGFHFLEESELLRLADWGDR